MYRYLAILWDPKESTGKRAAQRLRLEAKASQWRIALSTEGICIIDRALGKTAGDAHALHERAGAIVGVLFDRREPATARTRCTLDALETRQILVTKGKHLVENYWGSYVAIFYDHESSQHHFFCEPAGTLPCYWWTHGAVHVLFSHVEDCAHFFPIDFRPNRHYLSRWLLFNIHKDRECAIANVRRQVGGERTTISHKGSTQTLIWNAVEIASNACVENVEQAGAALRAAVETSIHAWASRYGTITHKLSGGLDSSIVAAFLASAPTQPSLEYLNFCSRVGFDEEQLHLAGMSERMASIIRSGTDLGDERTFARLIAHRWSTNLVERERAENMDLRRLWDVPVTVGPALYFTGLEIDDAEVQLAQARGSEAFFSGQGGDSIFLATIQPLAAIDYVRRHGFRGAVWEHLIAAATLSKDSIWSILLKAIHHGVFRRPYHSPVSILAAPNLLRSEVTAEVRESDFEGPWARWATSLPPGKRLHIRGLDGNDFYDYVFKSGLCSDHVDPLNSQPVWEAVLNIPTYTLLCNGTSRGLARRAFADVLPREIRARVSKGTGTPFYQRVVRKNKQLLLDSLLDGYLSREGYLDRAKVEACLRADEPFLMADATDILTYLSAEIWFTKWADRAASPKVESQFDQAAV